MSSTLGRSTVTLTGLMPGTALTVRQFLEKVNAKVPGIELICTHTREKQEDRLRGLTDGLVKLGIRKLDA